MSDSLLTLLEILDQVVQEEKLKEQASGGGASIEQELMQKIIKLTHIDEEYDRVIKEVNEKINSSYDNGDKVTPGRINKILRKETLYLYYFEYLKPYEKGAGTRAAQTKLLEKYFNIFKEDSGKLIVKRKISNVWEDRDNWDFIFNFISQCYVNKGSPRGLRGKAKIEIVTFFNDLIIKGLNSNAKQEGTFTLSDDFIKYFIIQLEKNAQMQSLFRPPSSPNKAVFPGSAAGEGTARNKNFVPLCIKILEYLKTGKAYYGTLLESRDTRNNNSFATDDEEGLTSIGGVYIFDNPLLQNFAKQLLNGNLTNFASIVYTLSKIKNNNPFIANQVKSKIYKIITKVAYLHPTIVGQQIIPYIAEREWDEDVQQDLKDIIPELGEDPSFTQPTIKTTSGKLSSDFLDTVEVFMGDAVGFEQRLEKYKEKMKMFSNDEIFKEEIKTINPVDFLNRVVLLDYFVEFSKGFSAQIVGYLFEYFLAGLFGGIPVGEEKGVVDIELENENISAKFLSPATPLKQSLSKFKKYGTDSVTYIVGRKKRSKVDTQIGVSTQEVKPLQIFEVDLYKFEAKYIEADEEGNKVKFKINDNDVLLTKEGDKVIFNDIEKYIGQPFSTIPIMSVSQGKIQSYRQTLNNKLNASKEENAKDIKKILNKVQEIFDNIKEGEISARDYVNTGNREKGTEAVEKLNSSTKFIDQMMNNLNYGTESQNQEDS